MPNFISEDQIEQKLLQQLQHVHGYDVLDEHLPETYDRALFKTKCDEVFALVIDHASHGRKWAA